jgi:hypothetical protein
MSQSYSLAKRKRRLDVALRSATSEKSLDERALTLAAAMKSGNEIFAAQRVLDRCGPDSSFSSRLLLQKFDWLLFRHCALLA